MKYTGQFPFGSYYDFKGLLYNPLGITEPDLHCNVRRTLKSKIIVTYSIHNSNTGEGYIGSTECFFTRWMKHLGDLRKGRHSNVNLQAAFDAHGEAAFEIRILRSCETTDGLMLLEEIDGLMNYKMTELYNIRLGNSFVRGNSNFQGDGTRTKRSTGKVVGRKNHKARWYDGAAV